VQAGDHQFSSLRGSPMSATLLIDSRQVLELAALSIRIDWIQPDR